MRASHSGGLHKTDVFSCAFSFSSSGFIEGRLWTYSLVQVDGVLAGDDVGDGGARLLGRRRLLGLRLGVVFHHVGGLFACAVSFGDVLVALLRWIVISWISRMTKIHRGLAEW